MSENERIEAGRLSSKQRRAIRSLLTKQTIAQASEDCDTSEATLYRWLKEPAFRQMLTTAEEDAIDAASRRLIHLTEAALSVITMVMADRNTHPATRLRAADLLLLHAVRFREMRSFEQRLVALEELVAAGNAMN